MSTKRTTEINDITNAIRNRILKGTYQPGYKLSENKLATEFSCSRTPIREAFKRLEADHLVQIVAQSGTYVKVLTGKEASEITEIRCYLESLAFRLAAERNAEADVLELLCEQMEALLSLNEVDYIAFGKLHYLFHKHMIELSGSDMLIDLYSKLNIGFASPIFYSSLDEEEKHNTLIEHREIVRYLRERDIPGGEEFIKNHLWQKRNKILDKLEKQVL